MIPSRFGRLLGAALLLVPSLAFGQTALRAPCTSAANGCTVLPVPATLNGLYQNDLFLQSLITTRFGALGAAAFLNVGTIAGTVADGGALAAETARAQAAETLKAPLASPAFTGIPTGPTAPAGTNTTQLATTAFVLANAGSGGGSSGVPVTRQILTSGLAVGGGDLTADRTITVPAAAPSDVATGTDQTKALTAFSVAPALASKVPTGRQVLAGSGLSGGGALSGDVTVSLGAGAVRADTAQSFTSGQQDQVRANLSGPVSSAPSASTTLAIADIDRPLFPTGTPTITMPNGGAGWRSGPIRNANTLSGMIPLAVPSGATLDGVTNGTTILRPYQRARIVQTGASAYVTDWIEQTPIIRASISSSVTSVALPMPVGYSAFEAVISGVTVDTSGTSLGLRFTSDGGATYKAGASDYYVVITASISGSSTASTAAGALSYSEIAANVLTTGNMPVSAKGTIYPGSASFGPAAIIDTAQTNSTPASVVRQTSGRYTTAALLANGLQLIATSGNLTGGTITLRAVP